MTDLPPGSGDAPCGVPGRRSTASTPRWVKVFGITAISLLLLFAVIVLTGIGGEHGPGRHLPSGAGPGGDTSPSSVPAHGVQQL
jgi:hypothetical protein